MFLSADGAPLYRRTRTFDGGSGWRWRFRGTVSVTWGQALWWAGSLVAFNLGAAALPGPVTPLSGAVLCGVELAALALVYAMYQRRVAPAESVSLRHGRLTVEQRSGHACQKFEFDPAWVRVEREPRPGGLVWLSERGRTVAIGRQLASHLRCRLAQEIRSALLGADESAQPGGATPGHLRESADKEAMAADPLTPEALDAAFLETRARILVRARQASASVWPPDLQTGWAGFDEVTVPAVRR